MTIQDPPFRRVLIANRGEIAVRIIRACHEMGMEAVAVYSDADASSAHVRLADLAVRLGPPPPSESYLRTDAIMDAALETGAEAIHPGYGFLAERAAFARAVEDAGLAFVGPASDTIEALGDKLNARRLAARVDVPSVPGTLEPAPVDHPDQIADIVATARRLGFPLLVKAAAGGGGRGMRRVTRADDLAAALVSGSREATSAFGDGSVYLEREILPARHIEVQLLADAHGQVVALGERDCSLQRRHQKLVEEAPAPGLSEAQRRHLHGLAMRLAQAAALRNAATCEFLHDPDGSFWFLEVNTRLQVEHGVTELVAGVDIVREQFRIAAGWPLSPEVIAAGRRAVTPASHAIEARIAAEDPSRAFAPTPGRVGRWVMPSGPGVRVDTHIEAGDRVPADYDNLIAKLMVHAPDRDAAIDRLRRALDEVEIGGVQTTVPFHRFVARSDAFRRAELSTGWVDANWDGEAARAGAVRRALVAAGLAAIDTTRVPEAATAAPAVMSPGRNDGARDDGGGGAGSGASSWRRGSRAHGVDRWPS
jgi:acetyl/propionyl-CoA carboxylase alpha subunit